MKYEKLIELVLDGKSVNARAKELGIGQKTLDRYVKAENLPDCDVAIIFAEATGLSIERVVRSIAAKKAELRPERAISFLRSSMASVLGLAVAVNLFMTPTPAQATPVLNLGASTLYIMSNYIRRLRRALKALFDPTIPPATA